MKRPGCAFSLDDVRADVLVERDGVSVRYREVPTLTCGACGLRLAWVPVAGGRVDAVFGVDLDSLAPGRVPRCGSLTRAATCPVCLERPEAHGPVACATSGGDGALPDAQLDADPCEGCALYGDPASCTHRRAP